MKKSLATALLLSQISHALATAPLELESKTLSVTADSGFPRIIQYRLKTTGETLEGQPTPVSTIQLNGQNAPHTVTCKKTGADSAEYKVTFPAAEIETVLRLSVTTNGAEFRVTKIKERGPVKLMTLAFPNNALLTLRSTQPGAAIATVRAWGYDQYRERLGPLDAMEAGSDTANYCFLSTGSLAAGIAGNHIDDCARVGVVISADNGVRTCAAQNPVWQFREIENETLPLPWVKVLLTGDRNGDGKANWQDAALIQRGLLPPPVGVGLVRTLVADQIAMNFASGAQQPFLRILDNIKKTSLITDGLGQSVLIKGFTAEGHDSANTDYGGHYNGRAGGLKDLNYLLENAGRHNARVGVHINATEAYPEATRYKPEILLRDGNGKPQGGWYWLDHSHLIDKRKDLLSGNLFASLELMRKEMPGLDFVYVDVYGDRGWNAWKLAGKLNNMGLPIYTEYASVFDPWSVWAHQPGCKSRILRFLWSGERDLFRNPDPLLRGADHVGFMGWQGERDTDAFLRCTFGRNLPTKYLQHFPLLRWENDVAEFGGGVKVLKTGDAVTCTQNGRTVMTWNGAGAANRLFVPWDPGKQEKIYVWDEVGTEQSWELPPAWKNRKEVYLYKLTDTGRSEETIISVTGGRVTLKAAKNTPFVLYPTKAPRQKPLLFGEGSPVKDPGFDSHGFAWWQREPGAQHIQIKNDSLGNARLLIAGANGAEGRVWQRVTGLDPGKTYAASVWAQVRGERPAMLVVRPDSKDATAVSNFVTRTTVRHSAPNDPRTGSNYQRLKVVFETPPGCTTARVELAAASAAPDSAVEFDDMRIVETQRSPETALHWFWEDFENVDMGYGPFTCCPGEFTHLSEANPPYTTDTLRGKFSLKSREKNGLIARTLPSSLRLGSNTRYRITCETMGEGRLVAKSGGRAVAEFRFQGTRGRIAGEFSTGNDGESYLALYKDGGDSIVIDDLALDELGAAPAPDGAASADGDERLRGLRRVVEEDFTQPIASVWKRHLSQRTGTSIDIQNGRLVIRAAANVSAFIERDLPPETVAVECRLNGDADAGQTWGPGLALLWADGKALRINLRGPDRSFGIDSTMEMQKQAGGLAAGDVQIRIRIEPESVVMEAMGADEEWGKLAAFPRSAFSGHPVRVRLGKTHGADGTGDHTDAGPAGTASYARFSAYTR